MKENNFIVDRIEGDGIVLENNQGEIIIIDKQLVKEIPSEGDILYYKDNIYKIDKVETENRKRYIEEMVKGMWEE